MTAGLVYRRSSSFLKPSEGDGHGHRKEIENSEAPSVESLQAALAESNELLSIAESEKQAAIGDRDNALAAKKVAEDRLSETERRLDETKRQADAFISNQQESFKVQLERASTPVTRAATESLIPMYKGGERIEVHPSTVAGHIEAGWNRS